MEKVYEVTKPGRLNKRKVLGKESRAVLIKKAMLKVFRNLFMEKKTYPTVRGEIDPKRQIEIDSINKNIEETKKKMDILRNKEGELTLEETKNLHVYNQHLDKMKKMKLVREQKYVGLNKIKSFFAYRPEDKMESQDEMETQYDNVQGQMESDIPDKEVNKLEEELKKEVQAELNNQDITPVAPSPIEEQKIDINAPVEEQKEEPTVEQTPAEQEKGNNKNNFPVDETIKKANVLIEKAARADKLEGKVIELTKTVSEKDNEIQKLQAEKLRMSEEIQKKESDWKQQIQRVRNELDELTKNFGLAEKEKEALEQKLNVANNAKNAFESKYNNAVQNIQNLMVENEKLNTFYESVAPVLNSAMINNEEQHHTK